jgi:hypothetical protein
MGFALKITFFASNAIDQRTPEGRRAGRHDAGRIEALHHAGFQPLGAAHQVCRHQAGVEPVSMPGSKKGGDAAAQDWYNSH